jgi:divalent metal cation (Fe/Co/Zn/Cd) transporter
MHPPRPRADGTSLAVGLILVTAAYNVLEGAIAIASGVHAHSLTLTAFGADSYLEVLAAAAVLWRLAARDEAEGEERERRALRLIAVTFFVLAVAVTAEALYALAGGDGAARSLVGLLLLAASLTVMPAVALAKLWTASRWNLPVLAAEAHETIACSYLSLTAFAGVVATALLGWWWIDAVAALAMVPWLVREGIEDWSGDVCFDGASPCFCRACAFGIRRCTAACCTTAGS